MRWRVSGEVALPKRAATNASVGTRTTEPVSRTACRGSVRRPRTPSAATRSEQRPPAGGEVSEHVPEIGDDGERPVELLAARAHADVEPAREHEIREPERNPQHADDGEGRDRLAEPIAPRDQHEHTLRRQHDRPVRVRRDGCEDRQRPERPGATIAPLDGAQERQVREGARKEEEAVHPPVDAVEEERPARRHEHRRDERLPPAGQPRAEERRRPGGWRPRRRRRGGAAPRGRARGARSPTRAGSGAARRRAPRARPGRAGRADSGRRRGPGSRPRAAARRGAGGGGMRSPRASRRRRRARIGGSRARWAASALRACQSLLSGRFRSSFACKSRC